MCYYCKKEGYVKKDCENLKLSIELRHAQREKRIQKNKTCPNSTSEFSSDNPYISNSAENTEKSNDSVTSENTFTPSANSNHPSPKLLEENYDQSKHGNNNSETQEQMIIESSTSTPLEVENENLNTEQDSDPMEVNADSDQKEESFSIATSKKSRKIAKKKDQSYPKSTELLRKRDLSSDNETKSRCY